MVDNGCFAAFIRSPHTTVPNFFPTQVDLKNSIAETYFLFLFFFLSDIFHNRIKHVKLVKYHNGLFSAFLDPHTQAF